MVLSNLSLPLVGAVDTAVMGRLPDPAYIGAVALGATAFHSAFWMFSFLRLGTTGEVAQARGAGDPEAVRGAIVRGVATALLLGIALALLAVPLAQLAFWLMRGSEAVETLGTQYFVVRMLGAPATLVNLVVIGVLIGSQAARAALGVQLLLNLTNVVLSIWFVIGLGFGVKGVAAASVIADYLAAGAGLWLLARTGDGDLREWRVRSAFALARLRALIATNADITVRSFCLTAAMFYFNSRSASLGDIALAANAVLLHFMAITAYGLDGFAHTAESLAGSAYGRRDARAFRMAINYTTAMAALLAVVVGALFLLFGEGIVALLTTQASVREASAEYLPWLVAAPLLSVWCFQLDGIFIGTLRTAAMRNAMLVSVALYVACVELAVPAFGNHGLWAAWMFLNVVRAVTLGAYLPGVARDMAASPERQR